MNELSKSHLKMIMRPREHNSVDRDMHYYMQGVRTRTLHLFSLKKTEF